MKKKSSTNPVIAILTADVHLREKPPGDRGVMTRERWYEIQAGYLKQLDDLRPDWDTPIFVAGDLFDRCDASPSVINFAIEHLPEVWAVAGNHDLPNHSWENVDHSAYGTLMRAGKVHNLGPGDEVAFGNGGRFPILLARGFRHGLPLEACVAKRRKDAIRLAVTHEYVCTRRTGHAGVRRSDLVSSKAAACRGWDVVLFGDNHQGFLVAGPPVVFNAGAVLRDRSPTSPQVVGKLRADGTVQAHVLDVSADEFVDLKAVAKKLGVPEGKRAAFVAGLRKLGAAGLDFPGAVKRWMRKHEPKNDQTERFVLEALEGGRK